MAARAARRTRGSHNDILISVLTIFVFQRYLTLSWSAGVSRSQLRGKSVRA